MNKKLAFELPEMTIRKDERDGEYIVRKEEGKRGVREFAFGYKKDGSLEFVYFEEGQSCSAIYMK